MRCIAIEEESPISPFGATLALMERLGVLDDSQRWKDVRDLRNAVNHDYEDDAGQLRQNLCAMRDSAPWLVETHHRLVDFADSNYG